MFSTNRLHKHIYDKNDICNVISQDLLFCTELSIFTVNLVFLVLTNFSNINVNVFLKGFDIANIHILLNTYSVHDFQFLL